MREQVKILLADDEEGVRSALKMVLKGNYQLEMAETGKQCLECFKTMHPQLILLDIKLPDADGIEILKKIRESDTSVPVIMITGFGTHKRAISALKYGAADFVVKPLNCFRLREIIEDTLYIASNAKSKNAIPTTEELLRRDYLEALKLLNRVLEAKDVFTHRHARRVAEFSVAIAKEMGLSSEELEVLELTGLLHDIGKIGVSDVLLTKPSRLTSQEWAMIKQHPLIGEKILEPLKLLHVEQAVIRHHHERWDGRGYPDHLAGEKIPLHARIMALADAYEAMTSERPYRRALTPIEAICELERCSGTQFDPRIVQAFLRLIKKKQGSFKNVNIFDEKEKE